MYRIIKSDGTQLGMTDSVLYITIGSSGCFAPCPADKAIGIAYNSTPYNLSGHNEIKGADTVMVRECDSGSIIFRQRDLVDELILSALGV